ncbi:hypothetical protein SAMN04488090_0743 [Siphonobacter aquaeclarae]|uniref:Uncharacterized protein n=1 Tax=Siphonobacter aquaeclarae TaxID=563176 RepID=A0A1G9JSL8_9BACT|nr:hypothetical protein SAMN04488090_0743 [Siphonobacter aquaeclarae]
MSVVSIFYDLSQALWFEIDKRKRYGNSLQVPKWRELKKVGEELKRRIRKQA